MAQSSEPKLENELKGKGGENGHKKQDSIMSN